MCSACEKDLEMVVPEILWQLLLEKEFICFLTTELVPGSNGDQPATDQSSPHALSDIESSKGIEEVKKGNMSWVCKDDDV